MTNQKTQPPTNQIRPRRRNCRFCVDPDITIDYKEPKVLGYFLTESARILPRRITGNCAHHQRRLTQAVKRARILALLPFN